MVHSANNSSLINVSSIPDSDRYYVAFSGGSDSTALLHTLAKTPNFNNLVTAIHINHNINESAHQWATHCQFICDQLEIPLIIESIELADISENSCRIARQKLFAKHLKPQDCLLTGHHQEDQLETIIFRLLRGTGLSGVTGMSQTNTIQHYTVHRPLFQCSKHQIIEYLKSHQLDYIEDPSNQVNDYRRNFIRNKIMPVLKEYDENSTAGILRSVSNLSLSNQLIESTIGNNNPVNLLSIKDSQLFATALYHWLNGLNLVPPSYKKLFQFASDCIQAASDKSPELNTANYQLKKWKNVIYALHPIQYPNPQSIQIILNKHQTDYQLPDDAGYLRFNTSGDSDIPITVKFAVKGEAILLTNHESSKKVKHVFQENNIAPWERKVIPFIYFEDQLVALGCQFTSQRFLSLLSEHKASFNWISPTFIL